MSLFMEMPNVVPASNSNSFSRQEIVFVRSANNPRNDTIIQMPQLQRESVRSIFSTAKNKISRYYRNFKFCSATGDQPSLLKVYIKLMKTFGVSIVNPNGEKTESFCCWTTFVFFNSAAVFQNFSNAKICAFLETRTGNLLDIVTVLYYLVSFIQSVHLWIALSSKVLQEYLAMTSTTNQDNHSKKSVFNLSHLLMFLTIFSSVGTSLHLYEACFTESVSKVALDQATNFSYRLFFWSWKDADKNAQTIKATYASELTTTSVFFAVAETATESIGWIQAMTIHNLVLVVLLDLYVKYKETKTAILSIQNLNTEKIVELAQLYFNAYEAAEESNDAFGMMLVLVHTNNWLYCAYFLLNCYQGDVNWLHDGLFGSSRLIIMVIYYYCAYKISTLESTMETHLQKISNFLLGRNGDEGLKQDVILCQQKIPVFRPGIGTGLFYVDGTFLATLGCAMLSCFLLFADTLTFNQILDNIHTAIARIVNATII